MKPWLIGVTAAIVMIAVVIAPGLAASISFGSNSAAGTSAVVASCDTDGVSVVRTLTGANVTSVTVGNIAAACGNGALSLTVDNGITNSSGTSTVPGAGGSVVVNLAAPIAATESMKTDFTIVGA